jgi:hypothetical protein
MAGKSDYLARRELEFAVGKTAMPTLPTAYLALFTAMPADDGTGGTECTGGSYARKILAGSDFGSAAGTAPSSITNSGLAITFVTPTADWGVVVGWGLYDALTTGNLLWSDWLGAHAWRPFSCTNASPGVLTAPAHGYSNGDEVVVSAEMGGTLPSTGGSWTGLKTVAGVTTDTFTAGVNTTGTGSGLVRRVVKQTVSNNVQVIFNTSTFSLFNA